TGPKNPNHTEESQHDRGDSYWVALCTAPAEHPACNEQGRRVVQADGCRQRKMGNGIETEPHGRDAGYVTPEVELPARRGERAVAEVHPEKDEEYRRDATKQDHMWQ